METKMTIMQTFMTGRVVERDDRNQVNAREMVHLQQNHNSEENVGINKGHRVGTM
jgi:hypothetical protein